MFSYIWPLGLVVLSNVFYQICAKAVPDKMNPFASLTITYAIGAIASLIMYFALNKNGNIIHPTTSCISFSTLLYHSK